MHRNPCPTCGRSDDEEHVGKQSAGWRFQFHGGHGLPESWQAWKARLAAALSEGGQFRDEYGGEVSLEDFEEMLEVRSGGKAVADAHFDAEGHPFLYGEFR